MFVQRIMGGSPGDCLFSNLSIPSPTSQLILQPFHHFTYITAHSPTLSSLYLHHSSFLQPFRCFTYITAHSSILLLLLLRHSSFFNPFVALPTSQLIPPTLPWLLLRHSSFFNPFVALPSSQLILQPSRCFTYVTVHSPTLLSLLLPHKLFT